MVLVFLLALQLISEVSSQFYNTYQQPEDFSNRKQSQNQPFIYDFRSQTQNSQMGRMPNQNYSPINNRQFQNPFDWSMNAEKMQNSYRQQEDYKRIQEKSMLFQRKMQEANTTQDGICATYEYFDTETSWCTLCSDKFTNCWSCDETACNSCIDYPAYLEPSGCTRCSANCISCNKTNCLACLNYSYLNSDGICAYCNINNCVKCNATSCIQCYGNFYLDNGQCAQCNSKFPNCNQCDESVCNSCYNGFYLDSSNNCIPCTTPHCDSCGMSNCYSCWLGYYLDSAYACRRCSDKNCLHCDNDICSSCKPNCYLDSSNTCNKCSSNCISCDENSCLECTGGLFPDSDGICKACSAKFSKHCDYCNKDSCTYCDGNYYAPNSDGVCIKCSDLFEGCLRCSQNSCFDCDTMYYMDLNHKCTHCGSGCLNCLSSTACWNCINGDFPFSDGTCNCEGTGVYMDSVRNTCEFCSEGCAVCSSSTACTTCSSPSMINNGDGTCSCPSGYHYNGVYCYSCSNYECKSCESVIISATPYSYYYYNVLCSSCLDGFYLLGHRCNSCPSGCAECNSQSCLRCYSSDTMIKSDIIGECFCHPGYRFDDQSKSCIACLYGCAECRMLYTNYVKEEICNTCFDAEYMINNWDGTCSCIPTMVFNSATHRCDYSTSHCAEYGSLGCSKCDQGYFLYDNSGVLECLSCSESCNSCTPHPGCYLCGNAIEKGSSTCTTDNSVGYLTRFQNGNLILDFAYDLPEPLSIKEIIIKSPGAYDTSSWYLTQITSRQYMIVTNLKSSDLPIGVKFEFNRG